MSFLPENYSYIPEFLPANFEIIPKSILWWINQRKSWPPRIPNLDSDVDKKRVKLLISIIDTIKTTTGVTTQEFDTYLNNCQGKIIINDAAVNIVNNFISGNSHPISRNSGSSLDAEVNQTMIEQGAKGDRNKFVLSTTHLKLYSIHRQKIGLEKVNPHYNAVQQPAKCLYCGCEIAHDEQTASAHIINIRNMLFFVNGDENLYYNFIATHKTCNSIESRQFNSDIIQVMDNSGDWFKRNTERGRVRDCLTKNELKKYYDIILDKLNVDPFWTAETIDELNQNTQDRYFKKLCYTEINGKPTGGIVFGIWKINNYNRVDFFKENSPFEEYTRNRLKYLLEQSKEHYREIINNQDNEHEVNMSIIVNLNSNIIKLEEELYSESQMAIMLEQQEQRHYEIFIENCIYSLENKKTRSTRSNREILNAHIKTLKEIKSYQIKNIDIPIQTYKQSILDGINHDFSNVRVAFFGKSNKKLIKLKRLAKRYSLKMNKSLLKNLKEIQRLQKKAKKIKIRITKKVKGKRVYKTKSQLTKELKKLKRK